MMEDRCNNHEGYMFMQNHALWRPRAWKARYFILTNECLYCFKRRGDLTAIPHDVIHIDNDTAIQIDEMRRGFRKRYHIRLVSNKLRKTFNLFCFSLEERNEWFTKILTVLSSKLTEKISENNNIVKQPSLKSRSFLEDSRYSTLNVLELKRPMSISCIELTNLGVIENDPQKTVTPIMKALTLQECRTKKISSSSLDIAIRTDVTLTRVNVDSQNGVGLHKYLLKNDKLPRKETRPISMCENLTTQSNDNSKSSRKKKTLSALFTTNSRLLVR